LTPFRVPSHRRMKVVDIVPGNMDEIRDLEDSDLDMKEDSFEIFRQAMLNESEFRTDDERDRNSGLPPTHKKGLNKKAAIYSKQFHAAIPASEISPTKVMDFDDGSSKVVTIVSSSPVSNKETNNLDCFDPLHDDSWEHGRQSDWFESEQQKNVVSPEIGEDVAPRILFRNEPRGGKTSNKKKKEGRETAKIRGTIEADCWGNGSDDHRGRNSREKSNFRNITSFNDQIGRSTEGNLISWVSAHEDDIYEGQNEPKLDSHAFPTLTSECENAEETLTSRGATDSFHRSTSTSLHTSPIQNNAQGQVDYLPLEESATKQSGNEDSHHESSHWERLLAKMPPGMRTSVKANILHFRRTIMACHQPNFSVQSNDVVEDSSVSTKGSAANPVNAEERSFKLSDSALNQSMISHKSCQLLSASMLSTSQEALSIPSDASTPIRSQTTRRTKTEPTSLQNISILEHSDSDDDTTLKLCIDQYEQTAFRKLMESLMGNSQIAELQVSRSFDGSSMRLRNKDDIGLLFKLIRSLSNLQILNLENFEEEEIHFVAMTQWQNQNLHTVRIHVRKGAVSQRLLSILAELPEVRHLTFEMHKSFPFHILFSSRTLESLTIVANNFNVDNLHAMELVQSVPKNQTLKKLIIEPPMRPRTFKLLASALRKNTAIEHIEFSLLPENDTDTNSAICELARTLSGNCFLRTVLNIKHSNVKVRDRTCDMVIGALAENYIIENFVVFDETPWFRKKKDMMLKENKGDISAIIPEIFHCVDEVRGKHWDGDRKKGNEDDDTEEGYNVGDGIATIGQNVKSRAKRAASGVADALDLVGIRM